MQQEDLDRDFWMRDLNTREAFRSAPAQYQRSLQWLRHFAKHALNHYHEGDPEEFKSLEVQVLKLTAHSARVTMLVVGALRRLVFRRTGRTQVL